MGKTIAIVGTHIGDYTRWFTENFKDVNIRYIQNNEDMMKEYHRQEELDLIVFTGGADVHPRYYSEEVGKFTGTNDQRDRVDFDVFQNFNRGIPKVGICRGSQFLTVASGGSLIQHVNGHTQSHTITTKSGSIYKITSTHHQMCYPFDVPEYKLLAWSTNYRSDTYLDGKNQEKELRSNFLEPEIIYYPKTNSLAIQGHPEYTNCPKETSEYVIKLIKKLIKDEL